MLPSGNSLPGASPLVVALVIFAGASLFAAWQAHTEPLQAAPGQAAWSMAESGFPSMTSMPATPEYSGSGRVPLSKDAGDEENGTSDAWEVFAVVAIWVLLLRDGKALLLACCNGPAKLSSMCLLAPERPG